MCLYPRLIDNPKYKSNKKNGGNVPTVSDKHTLLVPIACGKCMECMKAKAREWRVRLNEEIRDNKECTFITLTLSNESYKKLDVEISDDILGYERENEIATLATRRFLERWRAKNKKSVKHWFITELGGNGTENIHIHGLIWSKDKEEINKIWGYGYTFGGTWVNEQTINYMVKYMLKVDSKHKEYKPKVLTSKGIGSGYFKRLDKNRNNYKGDKTIETYRTRNGLELPLPIYYRNKIYSDEEKEQLWINKLNENVRYVDGSKIDMTNNAEEYNRALINAQGKNRRLGYGDNKKNWEQQEYEEKRRELLRLKRLHK